MTLVISSITSECYDEFRRWSRQFLEVYGGVSQAQPADHSPKPLEQIDALIAAQRAAMSPEARAEADVFQARLRRACDEVFAKPPEQRAQPTWREEFTTRREPDGRLTTIRTWVRAQPDERTARALEQRRAKHRRRRAKDRRKRTQCCKRPRTKAERIMREMTTVRLSPEYWPALTQEQVNAIKTWA